MYDSSDYFGDALNRPNSTNIIWILIREFAVFNFCTVLAVIHSRVCKGKFCVAYLQAYNSLVATAVYCFDGSACGTPSLHCCFLLRNGCHHVPSAQNQTHTYIQAYRHILTLHIFTCMYYTPHILLPHCSCVGVRAGMR